MSKAKVTLMGFETYTEGKGLLESLNFDFLSDEENDILRTTFLQEYYERPILVMNPDFFYMFIKNTCRRCYRQVQELYKAWLAEYNPLDNYDRTEEVFTTSDGNSSSSAMNKTATDSTGINTIDSTNSTINKGNTENKQSAFNNSEYQPHDKSITGNINEDTSNATNTNKDKSTINGTAQSDSQSSTVTSTKSHIHGNIGVTTSSAMKKEFIETTMSFNFFKKTSELIMVESQCFYYFFN